MFLIPCGINANEAEVTLGNIAVQRALSNEVKQFAGEMVKDHTAALNELRQLQGKLNQQLRPQSPDNTPTAGTMFKMNQEIEQACLATAQRDLEQMSGSDFDRAYIGMQVGMHSHLASALPIVKNYATSPELKKAIEDQLQVVARHLDQAKKLWKDLEHNTSQQK